MDYKGVDISGGAADESMVRLRATGLDCKANGALRQRGGTVEVGGDTTITINAPELSAAGTDNVAIDGGKIGIRGGAVDLHAPAGLVDLKGAPIKLNS